VKRLAARTDLRLPTTKSACNAPPLCTALPCSHAARFLTVLQGHCYDASNCRKLTVFSAAGPPSTVRLEDYMSALAGTTFEERWYDLGWLALISAIFVGILLVTARFVVWQKK
jgi:hypothetical protein